jgi:hypothetical protein
MQMQTNELRAKRRMQKNKAVLQTVNTLSAMLGRISALRKNKKAGES